MNWRDLQFKYPVAKKADVHRKKRRGERRYMCSHKLINEKKKTCIRCEQRHLHQNQCPHATLYGSWYPFPFRWGHRRSHFFPDRKHGEPTISLCKMKTMCTTVRQTKAHAHVNDAHNGGKNHARPWVISFGPKLSQDDNIFIVPHLYIRPLSLFLSPGPHTLTPTIIEKNEINK
jgi:hypothetical protein